MIIWKTNFADARVVARHYPLHRPCVAPLAVAPQLRSTQLKVTDNEERMDIIAIKAEKEMISRVLPAVSLPSATRRVLTFLFYLESY